MSGGNGWIVTYDNPGPAPIESVTFDSSTIGPFRFILSILWKSAKGE